MDLQQMRHLFPNIAEVAAATHTQRLVGQADLIGYPVAALQDLAHTTRFTGQQLLDLRASLWEINDRQFATLVRRASGDPYYLDQVLAIRAIGGDLKRLPEA